MAQPSFPGSESGTSDFERGVGTDAFLLAQRKQQTQKGLVFAALEARSVTELHALYSLGSQKAARFSSSLADLRNQLKGVGALEELHFLFHGEAGQLTIGGQQLTLSEITKALQGARLPAVNVIRFMDCLVMRDPSGVPAFGRLFRANRVIGFNFFRALVPETFTGLGENRANNAKRIKDRLHGFESFLIEGTPPLEQLPKGSVTLLLEAWLKDEGAGRSTFERDLNDPEVRPGLSSSYVTRSSAIHEVIPVSVLESPQPARARGDDFDADAAQAALAVNRELRETSVSFE